MEKKVPVTGITITILILLAILCLCACLVLITGGAWLGLNVYQTQATEVTIPNIINTATPEVINTLEPLTQTEEKDVEETLRTLNGTTVPVNDPVELAQRLGGKSDVPKTLPDTNAPYSVGDEKNFWVSNTDTNENFQVAATLRYVGDNIYFWIEEGVDYSERDLTTLADTFDQKIIPTDREFFGSEWNPGVDNDPRFYVLYAGGLGSSIAGYFSSADEVHPEAHPYSNAHEMFLMNSDTVGLNEDYIFGTMAHEFQHMIHWYQDKNEETWVNEGFSMLAEHVNGYDAGGFDYDYMANPDMQLNDWGDTPGQNSAHYGASYLFFVYFLDRFGEDATKALVHQPENGFVSMEKVAEELNLVNPETGKTYTGDEIFADWSVANFIQDAGVADGQYGYKSYNPYSMSTTQTFSSCPAKVARSVYQYGVHYMEFECQGTHSITFQGAEAVKLLPFADPSSGDYFFWSNMGDESNPTLSQTFDLTGVSGPVSLAFKTWYDLETDYDYVFISATMDGENWDILNSKTCTTDNPSGNSFGCGWNGESDGWMDEQVDLSAYAGQKVTVQFDYVTDAAVNGKGFALDDIHIDAIGYASDFEQDAGGWNALGFARVQNRLPQTYSLRLIRIGKQTIVSTITLDSNNHAEIPFTIGEGVDRVVLVISGTTPFTREKASYQLNIQ